MLLSRHSIWQKYARVPKLLMVAPIYTAFCSSIVADWCAEAMGSYNGGGEDVAKLCTAAHCRTATSPSGGVLAWWPCH